MKNFIRFILSLIIVLTSLLGCVVALCVVDPTLADNLASILYGDEQNTDSEQAGNGGNAPRNYGFSEDNAREQEGADDNSSYSNSRSASGSPSTSPYGSDQRESDESGDKNSQSRFPTEGPIEDAIAGNAPEPTYVKPDVSSINVPKEVEGRSDYKDIVVQEAVIEDDSAAALTSALDIGETGDGLSFDPLFYPYYNMLNDSGKHIYRQLYANAMARRESFAPVEPIGKTGLRTVIEALFNDQPKLFWMDTSYSCKYKKSGECVEIDLDFNRTAQNFELENSDFNRATKAIEDGARGYSTDYDKERYVHDAIIDMVDYVRTAEMSQSAYSALVNKKSVCAGYARAYQLIMQNLGIPCYYCVGNAGEDHAWNIVKLDDGYYNVDLTWDDTEGGHYDYFNKTDGDYAPTHVRSDLSVRLPACNATGYRRENEDPAERRRRSLKDAGFEQGDVLYDMDTYLKDCGYRIRNLGKGTYTFTNLVGGQELYSEVEKLYQNNGYRDAYLTEAMRSIGATSCRMSLEIEQLKDYVYLLSHIVSMS